MGGSGSSSTSARRNQAELGVLLERARGLLVDPGQVMLDLDVEPAMPEAGRSRRASPRS